MMREYWNNKGRIILYSKFFALCSMIKSPQPPFSKGGRGGIIALCLLLIALCSMLYALSLEAGVTGNCSNCHTMHNSQNGQPMAWKFESSSNSFPSEATPYGQLLRSDCIGCHTATDSSTWKSSLGAPIVYNTTGVTYGDPNFSSQFSDGKLIGLAAGNFYWLTGASGATSTQSRGHSIAGIPYVDDTTNHSYDPRGSCGINCHGQLSDKGCDACHLPAHHKGNSSSGWADANNGYYRFLGPLPASAEHKWGVRGYEDPNWQKNASYTVHNEYSGEAATTGYHSISTHCLGCHDSGSYPGCCASDVWASLMVYNATMVLPDNVGHVGSKWAGYRWCKPAGQTAPLSECDYHPMLPIARSNITSYTSPSDNVTYGSNDTLMCLTCHRAHASPYDKMLRWDNAGSLPETDFNCGDCHIP
jgi:hypothetical protein